jgi:hypothetical protein
VLFPAYTQFTTTTRSSTGVGVHFINMTCCVLRGFSIEISYVRKYLEKKIAFSVRFNYSGFFFFQLSASQSQPTPLVSLPPTTKMHGIHWYRDQMDFPVSQKRYRKPSSLLYPNIYV